MMQHAARKYNTLSKYNTVVGTPTSLFPIVVRKIR